MFQVLACDGASRARGDRVFSSQPQLAGWVGSGGIVVRPAREHEGANVTRWLADPSRAGWSGGDHDGTRAVCIVVHACSQPCQCLRSTG